MFCVHSYENGTLLKSLVTHFSSLAQAGYVVHLVLASRTARTSIWLLSYWSCTLAFRHPGWNPSSATVLLLTETGQVSLWVLKCVALKICPFSGWRHSPRGGFSPSSLKIILVSAVGWSQAWLSLNLALSCSKWSAKFKIHFLAWNLAEVFVR